MKDRSHVAIYSPEQQSAIWNPAPFRALIAGAGSGKTHTLTGRILHDIDQGGADPKKCVAITFTNAGADELKRRISHKLRFIGTLHSYCLHIVNHHGHPLGYKNGTVVMIDEKTEERLIEAAIKKANSTKAKTPVSAVRAFKGSQNIAKREGIIARAYCQMLRRANAVDFDTVLVDALALISGGHVPALDALYVDEYQDSGPWDSMIYRAIEARLKLVVGDPDQSIFEWRGGRLENILELTTSPDWAVSYLLDNYRSQGAIVEAANRLIKHNTARLEKDMVPMRQNDPNGITWTTYSTPQKEAGEIATEIKSLLDLGHRPEDFAVLVRFNGQIKTIAEALQGEEIPVKLREPKQHPWLGVAVSALNTAFSPDNEIISALWIEHVHKERPELRNLTTGRALLDALRLSYEPYGKLVNGMLLPAEALHSIRAVWGEGDILDMIPRLIASEQELETKGDGVLVSTIHGSKGLEWPTVYLAGCHAAALPGAKTGRELEAERRLLYVGMTRARDVLRISDTKKALKAFAVGLDDTTTSPFKAEVFPEA